MDRAIRRKDDLRQRVSLLQTLTRLNFLPYEIQIPILLEFNFEELITLCDELSQNNKLSNLYTFCNDVDFWYKYLSMRGFQLPDKQRFIDLIDVLIKEDQSLVNLLDILFTPSLRQGIYQQRDDLKDDLLKLWKDAEDHGKPNEFMTQIVLDFDSIWQQSILMQDRYISSTHFWSDYRGNHGIRSVDPRVIIIISIPKYIKEELEGYEQLTPRELVNTFLIEKTKAISTRSYDNWSKLPYDSPLYKQLADQNLKLVLTTLKRGDILVLSGSPALFYFFDGRNIITLTEGSLNNLYLPSEAIPYLNEKGINNGEDILKLYHGKGGTQLIKGVVSPNNDKLLKKW